MEWKKAKKKPVTIEFREVERKLTFYRDNHGMTSEEYGEKIETREGILKAVVGRDFIIRGVEGELYPITKTTFYKTYDVLDS